MHREYRFTAVVRIDGINPYVDVPPRVVKELGGVAKAAVLMKVMGTNATRKTIVSAVKKSRLSRDTARLKAIARLGREGWFRTTLVPSKSRATRLYLDMWMRETAGAGVGDRVRVTLKLDRAPRMMPVPGALRDALEANPDAKVAWETLAHSRRREILSYLNFLKTPAALARNVEKTIAGLLGERHLEPTAAH